VIEFALFSFSLIRAIKMLYAAVRTLFPAATRIPQAKLCDKVISRLSKAGDAALASKTLPVRTEVSKSVITLDELKVRYV